MKKSAVVSESSEIMEHLTTVLALVDFVPAMGVDMGSEVVPSGISAATNMAGKWLLSSMDSHVTPQVGGANEFASTHLTRKWSLWLYIVGFLVLREFTRVKCNDLCLNHLEISIAVP